MKHQPSAHKLQQIRVNSPQSAAELIINALPLRGQSLYKSRLVTKLQTLLDENTSQHTAVISSTASSTKFNWQYLKKFTLPTAGPWLNCFPVLYNIHLHAVMHWIQFTCMPDRQETLKQHPVNSVGQIKDFIQQRLLTKIFHSHNIHPPACLNVFQSCTVTTETPRWKWNQWSKVRSHWNSHRFLENCNFSDND